MPQEHRAGVVRRPFLDGTFPTVAEAFQSAGYATGAFVANGYWSGRQTGLNRGFIRFEDFYGNPADAVARTALGRIISYEWLPKLGYVDIPGRKRVETINSDFLDWMEKVDGRPFMAYLNFFDVHGPLIPPPPFHGRFAGRPVRRSGLSIGALGGGMPVFTPEQYEEMVNRYDESILSLDLGIGRLVAGLREKGVLDRTVLIITSDHGEAFGEHGMTFHGHSMFRDQIHVPLIVRFPPRVPGGRRVSVPVGAERVAATMLQLAGIPREKFPGDPLPLNDSGTAVPVVGGTGRRSLGTADWPTARGWVTSVVADSFHFILNEDGTTHAFLLSDRREARDLAGLVTLADSVTRWTERYRDRWETGTTPVKR
jgi:arylsulfatase A-like enzyme